MVFNATFNNISVISWWKPEYLEKTTDLSYVIDKLYHIMLYHPSGIQTHNVSGTDCIGSCKSNYHTIKNMTAPIDWSTAWNLFEQYINYDKP